MAEQPQCQNCGSEEQIAIDAYGIVVCELCVMDEACPELVQRFLDERRREAKESVREDERIGQ
jgi:hypothetical protein